MNNTFYITIVTSARSDKPVAVHSYTKIGPAKARRTIVKKQGFYDAKVFKCLYSLGCMTAVELDLT